MRRTAYGKVRGKAAALFLAASLVMSAAGCGQREAEHHLPEEVTLLDPVGVGESFEAAARRNLYSAKVYNAQICPYTEEYSLEKQMRFDSYAALPGDQVRKGQMLIRTNLEDMEKQIEEAKKSMAREEEEFQEYIKETEKSLLEYQEDEKLWGEAVERWDKWQEGEPELYPSEFECERNYRNALIARQKLEEQLRQRKELYELDSRYNQLLLQRMYEDKDSSTVLSRQKGEVANIRFMNYNEDMYPDNPMVAVINPDKRVLKCEYINKTQISGAKEVYAIIGGNRYEVEYQPMESGEYARLEERDGKVYSTFYLPKEAEDIPLGSYAVLVIISRVGENVLSVPKDAVFKEEDGYGVYVVKNGERVYTPVVTGMQDGVYVEILSGLEEGDKVLTEKNEKKADKTVILERGSVSHEFSQTGELVYPTQEWITCPNLYGTAYFEGLAVNLFQPVKKGDVLFKIRVKADDVELERKERELLRMRERLAELQKEPKENEKAIEQGMESMAELEKQLAEMKEDYAQTSVKAPYDGIITDLSWSIWTQSLGEGDLLYPGQAVIMLAKRDCNYVMVEDPNGLLSYGNEAEIEYKDLDGRTQNAAGQVVTLGPNCISASLFGEGEALIKVPAEDLENMAITTISGDGWWSLNTFNVTVTTRQMDNVVLVPKKAVTAYGGATYVRQKLEDGSIIYQSFVAGGSDDKNYWVAEGLTEGMEICIE